MESSPSASQGETAALSERIRNGDRSAFDQLIRRHWAELFDFAVSYTRDAAAAEDLLQDILLGIWEARASWQPGHSIRAYLFRSVRNRSLNYLRDRRRRAGGPLDHAKDVSQTAGLPDADLALSELEAALQDAVRSMPERRQLVYRLSRLYGLTYDEIAAVMGIGTETVRSQISSALATLRERLSEFL